MTALTMLQPKSAARMMTAALMQAAQDAVGELSPAAMLEMSRPQTRARNAAAANDQQRADAALDDGDQHRRDRPAAVSASGAPQDVVHAPVRHRGSPPGSASRGDQEPVEGPGASDLDDPDEGEIEAEQPRPAARDRSPALWGSVRRDFRAAARPPAGSAASWMKLVGIDRAKRPGLVEAERAHQGEGDDDEHQPEHIDDDPAMPMLGARIAHREYADLPRLRNAEARRHQQHAGHRPWRPT